jgi:hypothetical protein
MQIKFESSWVVCDELLPAECQAQVRAGNTSCAVVRALLLQQQEDVRMGITTSTRNGLTHRQRLGIGVGVGVGGGWHSCRNAACTLCMCALVHVRFSMYSRVVRAQID